MEDSTSEESFLTVAEIADLLKVNQQTVRNWIDAGALRAVRVGQRRVRVRRSDLEQFIDSSSSSSQPDAAVAQARSRLRRALDEARTASENADRAAMVAILGTLAETASGLADGLTGGQGEPSDVPFDSANEAETGIDEDR